MKRNNFKQRNLGETYNEINDKSYNSIQVCSYSNKLSNNCIQLNKLGKNECMGVE